MKKQFLFSFLFLSAIALFSFTGKDFDPLEATRVIAENTYMDVAEVSNLNWREFMSWHAQQYGKESQEYLATQPDGNVWQGEKFKPMQEYYLLHTTYNDYPVVGISHEQAIAYCNWRADRINESVKLQNKKATQRFSCRLPTKAEWEKLARNEMMSAGNFRTDLHNLQQVSDDGVVHEKGITSPVKSYTPTMNGYYNLIGNVAELVAEKGIAKGGSWQHTNINLTLETDLPYTQPTNWIGFRCVLEKK